MADEANTLAGLYGLRDAAPSIADVATGLGLGLLMAALIAVALRWFRAPRRDGTHTLTNRIAAATALPPPERIAALAGLLHALTEQHHPGPQAWTARAAAGFGLDQRDLDAIAKTLYRADAGVDPAPLEHAVRRAATQVGR